MPAEHRVITDVDSQVWHDRLELTGATLPLNGLKSWAVRQRRLRGGLSDGVDVVEIDVTTGEQEGEGKYEVTHINYYGLADDKVPFIPFSSSARSWRALLSQLTAGLVCLERMSKPALVSV